MPQNIGTDNYAAYQGIPSTTVTWTGRSGTSRSATLLQVLDVTPVADKSDTRDSQGEIQAVRTRNDRLQIRVTLKPIGANAAAALAIAGDLPKLNTAITVTGDAADTDLSTSGTKLVDEASKSYTPEGEVVINMTIILHVGKTFSALS